MKNMRVFAGLLAIMLVLSVGSAFALPTLSTDEVNKFKFTNFEIWNDVGTDYGQAAGNGIIDAGDTFQAVFNMTTILNVAATKTFWTPTPGVDELTGVFQATVNDGSVIVGATVTPGTLGLTFAAGDFFTMYYDNTNVDFTNVYTGGDVTLSAAWASATNGQLYLDIQPADYIEGYNDTATSQSFNRNWFDITTNNTGYDFVAQNWLSLLGSTLLHPVTDGDPLPPMTTDSTDHLSEVMMETNLFTTTEQSWMFRSEDPMYLSAVVPEPSTFLLFGAGLLGLGLAGTKRFKKS